MLIDGKVFRGYKVLMGIIMKPSFTPIVNNNYYTSELVSAIRMIYAHNYTGI